MTISEELRALKLSGHYECEDDFYSCPAHPEYFGNDGSKTCTCGFENNNTLERAAAHIEALERGAAVPDGYVLVPQKWVQKIADSESGFRIEASDILLAASPAPQDAGAKAQDVSGPLVVTEDALEAAIRAYMKERGQNPDAGIITVDFGKEVPAWRFERDSMRAALTAALPHLSRSESELVNLLRELHECTIRTMRAHALTFAKEGPPKELFDRVEKALSRFDGGKK